MFVSRNGWYVVVAIHMGQKVTVCCELYLFWSRFSIRKSESAFRMWNLRIHSRTRRLATLFTRARHWTPFWYRLIPPPHIPNLISKYYYCSVPFSSGPDQNLVLYACCMSRRSNNLWRLKLTNLLIFFDIVVTFCTHISAGASESASWIGRVYPLS